MGRGCPMELNRPRMHQGIKCAREAQDAIWTDPTGILGNMD